MTSSLRGQIWWGVGAVCPDALGGSENKLYYYFPVLCLCVRMETRVRLAIYKAGCITASH